MVESRFWEDVSEGEELPNLEFPITLKTLVLAVCGTRDLMPYHHNSTFTKTLGIRDAFVNTMFDQALFGRFATDWSGPDSDFRGTTLRMVGQLCPGDLAVVGGSVTRKWRDGDDSLAEVTMTALSKDHGPAAHSTATIAMPSRERGEVKPRTRLEKPVVEPDLKIPDFAKAWLGQVGSKRPGAYPVTEAQIMYWADMVEDANPLYDNSEYARRSRHGGMIAPPMSLITWTMGRGGQVGVEREAPDVDVPQRGPWPPLTDDAPRDQTPPGATNTIATQSVQEYGVPLRPGDRVFTTSETVNCAPLKRTALGYGYFQTTLTTFYNQRDEIVGTNLFTLLRYGVPEPVGVA